jgi:DNA ligase 1
MQQDLEKLYNFVEAMKATSKSTEKKELLQKIKNDDFIVKAIEYTYNPFKKFNVTSKNCLKKKELVSDEYDDFWKMLDDLTSRELSGNKAIACVNGFISRYPEYEDMLYSIIDKNIKIRAGDSIINKIIPDLIPTFDVALTHLYDEKRVNFEWDTWYASRKLDGVRCLTYYNPLTGDIHSYSREGNEFLTLSRMHESLKSMKVTEPLWFDGEICMIDESGVEDFQGIMKEINKKDHTIENPCYLLFDVLTEKEFTSQTSRVKLSDRWKRFDNIILPNGIVKIVLQVKLTSVEQMQELWQNADILEHEGIIIRKDTFYVGKRSHDILKLKTFKDGEFRVIKVESEVMRIVQDGREIEEEMMARVFVDHKGFSVGVGSGWSFEQRRRYHKNPEEILGKEITVRYFEETNDVYGNTSLRHPSVKHVWEKDRNI